MYVCVCERAVEFSAVPNKLSLSFKNQCNYSSNSQWWPLYQMSNSNEILMIRAEPNGKNHILATRSTQDTSHKPRDEMPNHSLCSISFSTHKHSTNIHQLTWLSLFVSPLLRVSILLEPFGQLPVFIFEFEVHMCASAFSLFVCVEHKCSIGVVATSWVSVSAFWLLRFNQPIRSDCFVVQCCYNIMHSG